MPNRSLLVSFDGISGSFGFTYFGSTLFWLDHGLTKLVPTRYDYVFKQKSLSSYVRLARLRLATIPNTDYCYAAETYRKGIIRTAIRYRQRPSRQGVPSYKAQYLHVPVTRKKLLEAVCIQLENNLQVKQRQKKNFRIVSLKCDENSIGKNNQVEKIHEIPTKRRKQTRVESSNKVTYFPRKICGWRLTE